MKAMFEKAKGDLEVFFPNEKCKPWDKTRHKPQFKNNNKKNKKKQRS